MNCLQCGAPLTPSDMVCGNCGAVIDVTRSAPSRPIHAVAPASRRFHLSSTALLILIFSCGLIALITAAIVGGVTAGLQDREINRRAETDKFYQEGLANVTAGKLLLAKADFEYVLQLNPNYPGAGDQLAQIQAQLSIQQTPTSSSLTNALDQLYQTAQTAYQAQKWPEAIDALTQVRTIDPIFQKDRVSQLLYTAALTQGLELLQQDRLEEGVSYLDQAAFIRALPAKAALQSQYAKMYLTARGYWNADWETAITRFNELYAIAPGYKDVFTRLVEAHVQYGDERVRASDFCAAQKQYQAAIKLRPETQLQTKLEAATQSCLTATPGAITGTVQINGLFAGRLAIPIFDASGSRVLVVNAGNPTPFTAAIGDQPDLHHTAATMLYRTGGSGIELVELADGKSRSIAPAGADSPSFSPDGSRVVYALQGQLYVVNIKANTAPIDLGAGSSPTWGSKDLIAYSGCDAGNVCGIMIRNPDKSDPPTRLTGSANDIPTTWSPDGFNISYYSNVTGNYELFFVNTAGGVQQVTKGTGNSLAGAWGPDGAHIAFLSDRDGVWSVYLAKYDGTEAIKIAIAPQAANGVGQRLSWAP